MRTSYLVGLTVVVAAGSVVAAPKHDKKKKKDDAADKAAKDKDKDKGKADAEIEMEAAPPPTPAPATTTTTDPTTDPTAVVTSATPAAGTVPLAIDERPLTVPKDKLEVHGGFPILVFPVYDLAGAKSTSTVEGFALGAAYGVNDKLEVGGDYAFALHPGNVKGPLTLHAAYRMVSGPKLDLAVSGGFAFDFIDSVNPMTMAATTDVYVSVQAGAWLRYRAANKLSIFTGLPATPNGAQSLSKVGFPMPPVAYQLQLGLTSAAAIALEVPVGASYQFTPNVYAFLETNLANIKIAHTTNAFIVNDFIPIGLGAFYSLDKLDIGAVFSDDLKQAGDYLQFALLARYYAK
jgi:hypothetical protein